VVQKYSSGGKRGESFSFVRVMMVIVEERNIEKLACYMIQTRDDWGVLSPSSSSRKAAVWGGLWTSAFKEVKGSWEGKRGPGISELSTRKIASQRGHD